MEEEVTQEVAQEEDDIVLHFRRFSKEKQDQIRALVNYATLMGLNGKDLVSIGGKLDRIATKRITDANRNIVNSMALRPIGKDRNYYDRWAYEFNGVTYHFDRAHYYDVRIKNCSTNKTTTVHYDDNGYQVGRFVVKGNYHLPQIMLAVYHGELKLP